MRVQRGRERETRRRTCLTLMPTPNLWEVTTHDRAMNDAFDMAKSVMATTRTKICLDTCLRARERVSARDEADKEGKARAHSVDAPDPVRLGRHRELSGQLLMSVDEEGLTRERGRESEGTHGPERPGPDDVRVSHDQVREPVGDGVREPPPRYLFSARTCVRLAFVVAARGEEGGGRTARFIAANIVPTNSATAT